MGSIDRNKPVIKEIPTWAQEWVTSRKISFILYEEMGSMLLGFNRFNKPGFIDHNYELWGEKDLERFYDLLNYLSGCVDSFEIGAFTYEVTMPTQAHEELKKLGFTEQKAGWQL